MGTDADKITNLTTQLRASQAQVLALREALKLLTEYARDFAVCENAKAVIRICDQAISSTTTPTGWLAPEQAERLQQEVERAASDADSWEKEAVLSRVSRNAWKAFAEELGSAVPFPSITGGNAGSLAWHCEQGKVNGGISLEALAAFLRSVELHYSALTAATNTAQINGTTTE